MLEPNGGRGRDGLRDRDGPGGGVEVADTDRVRDGECADADGTEVAHAQTATAASMQTTADRRILAVRDATYTG